VEKLNILFKNMLDEALKEFEIFNVSLEDLTLERCAEVSYQEQYIKTPIYNGLKLKSGNVIKGNAIIEEPTTTTVIPTGKICMVDAFGNYIIMSEK
jgi:N-methylhydantoinase A/oxoprolinase/acetone carboxylase beta subunit